MERSPIIRQRPKLAAKDRPPTKPSAKDRPPTKPSAKDRPPTKPSAKDNSPVSDKQSAQEAVVAKTGPLSQPLREPSEKPPAQARDKQIACKYCGHVNRQDSIYCEKCHRPLSDSMLKEWLLQRYFEACVMSAESINEVVGTQEDVRLGEVKADYVCYHKDGTETLLLVTTKFEEVLTNLIRYNAEKREKIEVVFLYVSTVSAPRLGEELVRQASLHNIRVRFFSA